MAKAVLFDFWGTLVENGTYSPLRQTYNILRVRMKFSDFVIKTESVLMTKPHEDQTSAFTEVCQAFNIEPKPFIIDKLIGVWNKNKLLAKLYPETINVLEELKKKKYKLAIVSNSPNNSVEPVIEKFGLGKYFDVVALSWETGYLKTDKELFENTLKKLKVKKEDALMVGDSIPTDIEGAKNAGVNAILVDRKGSREWPEKIKDLTELDTVLP
ncbi:HAD family hydrolase [Candidatus Woesearchaeota archaeon]|nr:HAD family hydrolase [Candidatus Woesearchaeota archaeon]MBW3005763.1 HAD family hydrolase [Candidatus Woesearchaeota archaeon]